MDVIGRRIWREADEVRVGLGVQELQLWVLAREQRKELVPRWAKNIDLIVLIRDHRHTGIRGDPQVTAIRLKLGSR